MNVTLPASMTAAKYVRTLVDPSYVHVMMVSLFNLTTKPAQVYNY